MSALSVRADNLQKHYAVHGGIKKAVDGVSFSLQEGERLGLIGPNGAGKTTLLQLLAGISDPSGGSLHVQGHVTAIFTLGMALRDDLPGRENIFVEGELQGRTREQTGALVDDIVAFAELGEFIDRPVRTYSTGMKARLAFSTIVHIEPEILIIDEALSVGDARFAAKATQKMRELTQRGKILILVSHSMGSITDMCTRCIWLQDGAMRRDGNPKEVTDAYVQEVREKDGDGLLKRFQRDVVRQSLQAGWDIAELAMHSSEGLTASTLVTGEPAMLAAQVRGEAGSAFDARLRIERLDGLLVLEERACGLRVGPEGQANFKVDFGALRLNYGFYRALLETSDPAGPTARRSALFEVFNPRPHRGGRPILVYPTSVRVTPLAP
ncbi:MAG TPA: ABC transporter ATP-binding protein [Ramlibacter sp.]|nr:ABC transporter ATP-binding protein [Ramlibacter sp.]